MLLVVLKNWSTTYFLINFSGFWGTDFRRSECFPHHVSLSCKIDLLKFMTVFGTLNERTMHWINRNKLLISKSFTQLFEPTILLMFFRNVDILVSFKLWIIFKQYECFFTWSEVFESFIIIFSSFPRFIFTSRI